MDHFEVPSDVHHGEANLMAFDSSPYEVQRWRRYRFMYAEREKLRVQGIQGHRLFLVVDESLMLFLASRQGRRLSALFRCTLPFSAVHPYATTSGLVPPELFYGREPVRQAVRDQSGACFIYGGRQLGKTALLRRVERDFNRSRETHVAKWIDLKVNEIGYARGA